MKISSMVLIGTHHIDKENGRGMITGNDGFIVYQLEMPINGIENDFIRVVIESSYDYDLTDESDFQIFWTNSEEAFSEEKSFMFAGNDGNLLLPMGASPHWSLSEDISYIRFDFPATMEGKELPNVTLEIYSYRD